MSIARSEGVLSSGVATIEECGIKVLFEVVFIEGDMVELEHSEDFLFGCDYATVVVTTDKNNVEALISLISVKDIEMLKEEFEINAIPVYNINGVYIISLEYELMNEAVVNKINNEFITFGASIDDVDIPSCLIGYRFKKARELTVSDFLKIEEFNEKDFEDEVELDEVETGVDFLQRIYEYHDTAGQHREIDAIFENLNFILE